MACLGAARAGLGAVLDGSWGVVGGIMGRFGVVVVSLGHVPGPSESVLGPSWSPLGPQTPERLILRPVLGIPCAARTVVRGCQARSSSPPTLFCCCDRLSAELSILTSNSIALKTKTVTPRAGKIGRPVPKSMCFYMFSRAPGSKSIRFMVSGAPGFKSMCFYTPPGTFPRPWHEKVRPGATKPMPENRANGKISGNLHKKWDLLM